MNAIILQRLRTVLCAPDSGDRDEPPRSRSVQGTCDTMKKISSLASRAMDSLLDHLLTLQRPCLSLCPALRCIIPGAIGGANPTCDPDESPANMFMLVMTVFRRAFDIETGDTAGSLMVRHCRPNAHRPITVRVVDRP